jgi:hypothetical protein
VSKDSAQVETEVVSLFEALFQGRHTLGWVYQTIVDSGMPFQPGFERLDDFLAGLLVLSADDNALMGLPVNFLNL